MKLRMFGPFALMACILVSPTGLQADDKTQDKTNPPANNSPGEPADQLAKLLRALQDFKLDTNKRLDAIEAQIRSVPAMAQDIPLMAKELDTLKRRLDALNTEMEALRNTTRTNSNYAPRDNAGGPRESTSGRQDLSMNRIQLVNSWNRVVVVTLDNQEYVLHPGQTKTISRTPGTFTYQVHDLTLPRTRTLAANGTPMVIEITGP